MGCDRARRATGARRLGPGRDARQRLQDGVRDRVRDGQVRDGSERRCARTVCATRAGPAPDTRHELRGEHATRDARRGMGCDTARDAGTAQHGKWEWHGTAREAGQGRQGCVRAGRESALSAVACVRLREGQPTFASVTVDLPDLSPLHERIAAEMGPAAPEAAGLVVRFVTETMNRAARRLADGTVYLVTGDIPAMWLRDSAAQVVPLLRLGEYCPPAEQFVSDLLRRQLSFITLDPYANAFNAGQTGAGHQRDKTEMSPHIWERKYEVDSLCYPLYLAERFCRSTGRTDVFDVLYWRAVERSLDTWETEQDHEARSRYRFQRRFARSSGTLARGGRGKPVAVTGMTWSAFRPSDDACIYNYNVPGNMFASLVLAGLPEIAKIAATAPPPESALPERASRLREAIEQGLREHAVVDDPVTGPRWAYEVDGLGGVLEMDDANVPSLLSLPRLGYCRADDPLYAATRAFILSPRNPYYYRGSAAAGIGSPHTPRRHVWPIALAMAALTTADEPAKRAAATTLLNTRGGTARIHESFHVDRPERWTRRWFSWAEATFCDLVLDCCGFVP